mmetsp:Transcript_110188/g.311864  ORF Transcript_110188/g.311864 Transcript_110188/m.311864 type:complete len:326 (-) Transcript_110188:619-1596(-)
MRRMTSATMSAASSPRRSFTSSGWTPGSTSSPSMPMSSLTCTSSLLGAGASHLATASRSSTLTALEHVPVLVTKRRHVSVRTQARGSPSRPPKVRPFVSSLPYFISRIWRATSAIPFRPQPKQLLLRIGIRSPTSVMTKSFPPQQCRSISAASTFDHGRKSVSLLQSFFLVWYTPSEVILTFPLTMGSIGSAAPPPPPSFRQSSLSLSKSSGATRRSRVCLPQVSVMASTPPPRSDFTRRTDATDLHGRNCLLFPLVVSSPSVSKEAPLISGAFSTGSASCPPLSKLVASLKTASMVASLPLMAIVTICACSSGAGASSCAPAFC